MKTIPMLILCLLGLISCQYDPHGWLLTTTEPMREDVIGTYVLDRIDLTQNMNEHSINITVELRADGTFTAINVPPQMDFFPKSDLLSVFVRGAGKWEIGKTGTLDSGSRPIWGVYLRDSSTKLLSPNFTGDKSPYGLIFQLGDPDSGDAILLKKMNPRANQ